MVDTLKLHSDWPEGWTVWRRMEGTTNFQRKSKSHIAFLFPAVGGWEGKIYYLKKSGNTGKRVAVVLLPNEVAVDNVLCAVAWELEAALKG